MKSLYYTLQNLNKQNFNSNKVVSDFIKSNEKEIDDFETMRDNELSKLQCRVTSQETEIRLLKDEISAMKLVRRSE